MAPVKIERVRDLVANAMVDAFGLTIAPVTVENTGQAGEAVRIGKGAVSLMRCDYLHDSRGLGGTTIRRRVEGWAVHLCRYDAGDRETPPSAEVYEESRWPNYGQAVEHALKLYVGKLIENAVYSRCAAQAEALIDAEGVSYIHMTIREEE